MIKIRNLEKTYITSTKDRVPAINDISITLNSTGLVFFIGASGSGKTTLLNLIGGLDYPTSGSIDTFDNVLNKKNANKYRTTLISFVFQEFHLLREYNVYDNVALAASISRIDVKKEAVENVLKQVELDSFSTRMIDELSGGQKQRIAIARALLTEKPVILADEPTGSLDATTGENIFNLLLQLSKRKLVIIISHDLLSARKYGDRIIEIKNGLIISDKMRIKDSDSIMKREQLLRISNKINDEATFSKKESAMLNYILRNHSASQEVDEKDFIQTADIPNNSEVNKELINSRVNTKIAFKLALSGLKHKTLRLLLSFIFSVFSLTLLLLTLLSLSFSSLNTELSRLNNRNIKSFSVSSRTTYNDEYTLRNNEYIDDDFITGLNDISDDIALKEVHHHLLKRSVFSNLTRFLIPRDAVEAKNYYDSYNPYYLESINRLYELDKLPSNYSFATSNSKLPSNYDEILITDYTASVFKYYGYVDFVGSLHKIDNLDQLIGKEIEISNYGFMKISGIVTTDIDLSLIEKHKDKNYTVDEESFIKLSRGVLSSAFVLTGFNAELNKKVVFTGRNNFLYFNHPRYSGYYYTPTEYSSKHTNISYFDGKKEVLNDNEIIVSVYNLLRDKETVEELYNDLLTNVSSRTAYMSFNGLIDIPNNYQIVGLATGGEYDIYFSTDNYAKIEEFYISQDFTTANLFSLSFNAYSSEQLTSVTTFSKYPKDIDNINFFDTSKNNLGSYEILLPQNHGLDSYQLSTLESELSNLQLYGNIPTYNIKIVGVAGINSYVFSDFLIGQLRRTHAGSLSVLTFFTSDLNQNKKIVEYIESSLGTFPNIKEVKREYSRVEYFSEDLKNITELLKNLEFPLLISSVLALLLATYLLLNFLSVNVMVRSKEIGIIKSFGTSFFGVAKIFIVELLIILSLVALFSFAFSIIGTSLFNSFITWEVLFYNFTTFAQVILLSIGIGLISIILPLLRVARISPIEIIRNN